MLKLSDLSRRVRVALVVGLCAGIAAPAVAGTFYSWKTEDGVKSFTDDVRRIPARYRDRAEAQESETLEGFKRFTPIDAVAKTRRVVPSANLPAVSAGPRLGRSEGVILSVDDNVELELGSVVGDEPIVVEQIRTRHAGSNATRTIKVVRQGDRVIAVIKPSPNESNSSFQPNEAEFE